MSIEAMKQALEALEYDTRPETEYGINSAITILRQAIAEAEKQEPVIGTKTWFEDGKVVTQHLHPSDIYKDLQPKREWVGLTDEDLRIIILAAVGVAEAKLKEKNT